MKLNAKERAALRIITAIAVDKLHETGRKLDEALKGDEPLPFGVLDAMRRRYDRLDVAICTLSELEG